MAPIDELTDIPLDSAEQQRLVARYCAGIDDRIENAPSPERAQKFVEESCRRFAQACPSSIVRTFLSEYVKSIYEKHWGAP